jgi:hypothetical protein
MIRAHRLIPHRFDHPPSLITKQNGLYVNFPQGFEISPEICLPLLRPPIVKGIIGGECLQSVGAILKIRLDESGYMLCLKKLVCLKLGENFLFTRSMKAYGEKSDQKDHKDCQTDNDQISSH